MLTYEPENRPTAEELLEHILFKQNKKIINFEDNMQAISNLATHSNKYKL